MARRENQNWSLFEKIDLFKEEVEKIRNTRIAKNKGLKEGLTLKFTDDGKQTWNIEEPDEDEFRSFLLIFRIFIRRESPIKIGLIYDDLTNGLKDEKLKSELVEAKKKWEQLQEIYDLKLTHEGRHITPERITNLYINAKFFHPENRNKRKKLENLDPFVEKLYKHNFYGYVIWACIHALYLDSVIKKAIDEDLLNNNPLA